MHDGTTDSYNHVAQYKKQMLTVAIQKKLREATICNGFGSTFTFGAGERANKRDSGIQLRSGKQLSEPEKRRFTTAEKGKQKESEQLPANTPAVERNTEPAVGTSSPGPEQPAEAVRPIPEVVPPREYIPKVPYPVPAKATRKDIEEMKCRKMLEDLTVRHPLKDAIQMMPSMRSFMKGLISGKISEESEFMTVSKECSKDPLELALVRAEAELSVVNIDADGYAKMLDSARNLSTKYDNVASHMRQMDIQIAQTAESVKRQQGTLPGKTDKNPKECNAVQLRSGKQLSEPEKRRFTTAEKGKQKESEQLPADTPAVERNTEPAVGTSSPGPEQPAEAVRPIPEVVPPREYIPKVPYPVPAKATRKDREEMKCRKMLEDLTTGMPRCLIPQLVWEEW
ncbi:hypothetical protein DY000_02006772 [Brassica cretica]|uniref:Uncharacterized protein n=1 Tax=Brassica cretica TaxID=69181 RepID=A0ABQ7CF29_BRACR|nr:hypothetical protein DY000_02006772 [Brassica cretica]